MKANKVKFYIRIRRHDGKDAFVDPVWNRNRTLRAGYAQVNGAPAHRPEGIYYLRYLREGKRVWEAVGVDAEAATVALRNKEHDLQPLALGRVVSPEQRPAPELPEPERPLTLADAVATYLSEIRQFRSKKTILACEHMLALFLSRFPAKTIRKSVVLISWITCSP